MKNRIPYVDLAKGICISIVMLFHIRGINPQPGEGIEKVM